MRTFVLLALVACFTIATTTEAATFSSVHSDGIACAAADVDIGTTATKFIYKEAQHDTFIGASDQDIGAMTSYDGLAAYEEDAGATAKTIWPPGQSQQVHLFSMQSQVETTYDGATSAHQAIDKDEGGEVALSHFRPVTTKMLE